ncbi:cytochrome P450 [Microlunatus ginsengisoli]|uniref:Cytochrome P450 n=1 Tax=Microlunatus ginsengisoli TaxID=363863 RepID=A0ABP6ZZS9_9ACTN
MTTQTAGLEVPTLSGWPVVGSLRGLRSDYLGTISRADRDIGGLARIVAGPPGWRLTIYSVTAPDLIEEVLASPDRFGKHHPGYRELRSALGDNMLTSEHETWHRQRRFLASMFTRRRLAEQYAPVMTDEAQRLVERWRGLAARGVTLDAYPEMVRMASRVSGRILFGADMSAAAELLTRFRVVNDQLLRRAVSPHPPPGWAPTPGNRRIRHGLREARAIADDLVTARRGPYPVRATDMLGLLCAARDAEDEADRLTDREVADQAMLFLLAGHDTTAVTLSCVLLMLAQHPEWQRRLRAEVDHALRGRPPSAADLDRLPWTDRVVRETLRLFPAAHGMGRSTATEQTLGAHRIPAGSWVEVSIWGAHHSARVWPDPERFDPSRFDLAEGEHPGGHRYAWLPFGVGARACIGRPISLTEVQITVATVLQAFEVTSPLAATPVHAAITLMPTGRLPLDVRPR